MGKSRVNEETDQHHKRHNKQNEKHKRKQKLKKNKKKLKEERSKLKEIKKQKETLKKLKLSSEAFASRVTSEDIYTMKKIVHKLLKHNQDSIQELPELFDMLDKGFEVNIKDLSDSYVLGKLNKVFKLLKLKRSKENKLEFKKKEKIHDFMLKPLFQHFIDEYLEQTKNEKGSEGSDAEDDSESAFSSSEDEADTRKQDKKRKRSRSRSQDSNSIMSDDKPERQAAKPEERKVAQVEDMRSDNESEEDIGPSVPENHEGDEFLASTMNLIKQDGEQVSTSKDLEDHINAMFEGAQSRSKRGQPVQQEPKAKYLGAVEVKRTPEEEAIRQQEIAQYLEAYNAQHRQKSLMEEFQEQKNAAKRKDTRSKDQRLNDMMARPFDKEKDLKKGGSGKAAERAFNVINKNPLDKKFRPSGSFM